MRKMVLAMSAVGALTLGAFGCSHSMEQAKADYHHDKAERAAEHGHFIKAAHEQHKANIDEDKAESAPLP